MNRYFGEIALAVASVFAVAVYLWAPASQQVSERWPPADFEAFQAQSPKSVGAELADPWNLAIDAERWSYIIGRAITGVAGALPAAAERSQESSGLVARADQGIREATRRLKRLHELLCTATPIASAQDCANYVAPPWAFTGSAPSKPLTQDELFARNLWFHEHADRMVRPACSVAAKTHADPTYCVAE